MENRPIIQYHLGMIYLSLGDKVRAKKHLREAVQIDEAYPGEAYPGREEAEKTLKEVSSE
jgi:Tfp pilus assembly protein PilF